MATKRYPEHLVGDDVVFIYDPSDLPHHPPENEIGTFSAFVLSAVIIFGVVVVLATLFYILSLLV